jgi:WD40 repeat protein
MIHAVAFVDDGKTLAVGDGEPPGAGGVTRFETATGAVRGELSEPKGVVWSLARSPDGALLAAGDDASAVNVWDLAAAKLVRTLDAHKGRVLGVAFSRDGKRLATGSADQTLIVWNVESWEPLLKYDLPAAVRGVAFSPDGSLVVAAVGGPGEWSLRVGNIETDLQQSARRKPVTRMLSTGSGMPLDVLWPANGPVVYVPCHDQVIRAFQGGNGAPTTTFAGHADWVYGVAATPDGSKLASGGADGTVRLWNVANGKLLATLIQLAPGADDWLIVTPAGFYATSSVGAVLWRSTRTGTPQDLSERFHKVEPVRAALNETHTPAAAIPRKNAAQRPGGTPKKKKQ